MAIVNVSVTDVGDVEQLWAVPADASLNKTPIPRGIRHYHGQTAIAALGVGDQTAVVISFTFPSKFVYLAKSMTIAFSSDDITSEFDPLGVLNYAQSGSDSPHKYQLKSEGNSSFGTALVAENIYRPLGTWREWINGPFGGASVSLSISDTSGDASTAGDVFWNGEFWIYDLEQCMNWPVNVGEMYQPYPG